MADIVDIALSAEASGVADSILEKGLFKNKSDVMTFAAWVTSVRKLPVSPSSWL